MIHAYLNPLVKWIWFGGIVVVLGTVLAMLPNRRAALVLKPVRDDAWAGGGTAAAPSAAVIRRVDSHD